MRCFRHPEKEAVGTCKACGKGLCVECVTDLGHGIACKDEHEELVETYNTIIEKNSQVYAAAPKNTLIAPAFYAFFGAVFTVYGLTSRQGVSSLTFVLGAGFIIFAVVIFIRNRKLFGSQKENL